MKHKLSRQLTTNTLNKLISREIKKQNLSIPTCSKKTLQEMASLLPLIEKKGLPPSLVCRKLPHSLGYGIFLHPKAEPITRGTLIAPYSGLLSLEPQYDPDDSDYAFAPLADIRLKSKEQALFDPKRRYHPRRLYILNLDAQKQGNFTRFINHSEKPNLIIHYQRVPKNPYGLAPTPLEVFYFAKKAIRPGEQLLVSYEDPKEKTYWGAMNIKPYPLEPKTFTLSPSLRVVY